MNDALPVMAVIATIAVSVIIVRLASALAKWVERRPPGVAPPDPAIREEIEALQERVDFIERILAQKEQSERALPRKNDQPEPKVRTPS